MSLAGLRLRRYEKGDEIHILGLFREVYGHRRSLAHWKWKFEQNALRRTFIWLAEDGRGRLVAHYAVCPVPLRVNGKTIRGAQSLDTMVAKAYHRRGLMTELATRCYEDARGAGIDLIYGYPNALSHRPLVENLGFMDLGPVPCFELDLSALAPLTAFPLARRFLRGRGLHENRGFLETAPMRQAEGRTGTFLSFDSRHEALGKKARKGRNSLERSSSYLTWRYCRFPDYSYLRLSLCGVEDGLRGYAIIGVKGRVGYLAELMPVEERAARALLGAAVRLLRREGIWKLVAYFLLTEEEKGVMKDAGFIEKASTLIFCVKPLREGLSPGIGRRGSWLVSFGDTDGV